MDKHEPLKKKVISDKLKIPRFNDTAAEEIKHRRKLGKDLADGYHQHRQILKRVLLSKEKSLLTPYTSPENSVKINATTLKPAYNGHLQQKIGYNKGKSHQI